MAFRRGSSEFNFFSADLADFADFFKAFNAEGAECAEFFGTFMSSNFFSADRADKDQSKFCSFSLGHLRCLRHRQFLFCDLRLSVASAVLKLGL